MSHDDRNARWFAYLLGEHRAGDRDATREQMAADPDEAAVARKVIAEASAWAKQGTDYTPFDPSIAVAASRPSRYVALLRRWPWALAAAVLLVMTFSQGFSVRVGGAEFALGRQIASTPAEDSTQIAGDVAERIDALEDNAAESARVIEALAVRALYLENQLHLTATTLAENQRLETEARYTDMQHLAQFYAPAVDWSGQTSDDTDVLPASVEN